MSKFKNRKAGHYDIQGVGLLPSVTTITKKVLNKEGLNRWLVYQGAEVQRANPTITDNKEIYKIFDNEGRKRMDRGSRIHSITESYYKTGQLVKPLFEDGYYQGFAEFIKTYKVTPKHIEIEVYSEKYGYAGTCDMVGEINGQMAVIDWKTGKETYKEHGLQLSAYKHAVLEMGLVDKIDTLVIALFREDGTYKVEQYTDSFETFLHILEVYKWLK